MQNFIYSLFIITDAKRHLKGSNLFQLSLQMFWFCASMQSDQVMTEKEYFYGQTNLIIGESMQTLQLFLHLREAFQSIRLKALKNLDTFIFI